MTDPRLNDAITRRQLLRRAAVGGAALTLPSILAACGSGGISAQSNAGGASTEVNKQLADKLVFANWPLYIDQKGKSRPSLEEFTRPRPASPSSYVEEVNDNEEWFGKYQAQLSPGPGHRPRPDRPHRLDGRADGAARLRAEEGQERDPERVQPRFDAPAPSLGPEPRVQPPLAVRLHRHRLQPEADRRPRSRRSSSCSPIRRSRARSPA